MELWTALAIGFFGSFHCIGMCGPIALALPGSDSSKWNLIIGRILYNLGRVVTYSLLGALFGIVGHSIALAGFQQVLSVTLGLLVIAAVFIKSRYYTILQKKFRLERLFDRLKTLISAKFKKQGMSTLFTIGILNGLLPCGFVYVGLAGSLTTGTIWGGSIFMALFGVGTFPAMMAMSLAPGFMSISFRRHINKAIPVLAVLFGAYLIYRGLFMDGMGHF